MSWERTELDWLIERWETEATPWSRPTLLEWLRYVDGCLLRGVRYHVPQRCCPQVREAAWHGRPPGRRGVDDVSGCGERTARGLLAHPELWRDPYWLAEDPRDILIRQLRSELDAVHGRPTSPDAWPTIGSKASQRGPSTVPGSGTIAPVQATPASQCRPSTVPIARFSARVHPTDPPQDQDPSARACGPQQVPLPPTPTPTPTPPPVGKKSRPTIADPPPPPKVVRVAGVDVPDDLSMLLDRMEVPWAAQVVVKNFGVYSTSQLLALPARSFEMLGATKLALRNQLRDYLPSRWGPGVVLGALAPADPDPPPGRGPPRTGRRGEGLAAQLVASMAARQQREGAPDDDRVVDADYEEVE